MSDSSRSSTRLPVARLVLLGLLVLTGVVLFFLLSPGLHPVLIPGSGGTQP